MDDSGMFSIQVIVKALESFSLSLINLESEDTEARQAKSNPQWVVVSTSRCRDSNIEELTPSPR